MSILDRFIFVNVEVGRFLWNSGQIPRASTKLYSNNVVCAIMLEVKFKTTSYFTIL